MKTITDFIINEQNDCDASDAARTAINKFTNKPVESFINSLIWGIEDGLKSFKPKKEYDHVTPELIDQYKKAWVDFAEYLKKYAK